MSPASVWRRRIVRAGVLLAALLAVAATALHLTIRTGPAPVEPASEDRTFADPRPVEIEGYAGHAMEPFVTRDGRFLVFNNLNAAPENTDLLYAEAIGPDRFRFLGPVRGTNTPALDAVASADAGGRFVFTSTRLLDASPGRHTTLFGGRWEAGAVTGVAPVPGPIDAAGPDLWINMDAELSGDGEDLYISRARFRPPLPVPVESDLLLARRHGDGFAIAPGSARLLAAVNTDNLEFAPCTSADGRELYFTRCYSPGLTGPPRFWLCVSRRASRDAPFGPPAEIRCVKAADPDALVEAPTLSRDGRTLYYHRKVDGWHRIWRVTRR